MALSDLRDFPHWEPGELESWVTRLDPFPHIGFDGSPFLSGDGGESEENCIGCISQMAMWLSHAPSPHTYTRAVIGTN